MQTPNKDPPAQTPTTTAGVFFWLYVALTAACIIASSVGQR